MRAILALAILLLEISSAAPEPEYSSSRIFNSFQLVEGNPSTSLVEIESSIGKGDRLVIAMLPSSTQSAELQLTAATQITNLASNNSEPASDQPSPPGDPATATPISLGALCNALFSSAQDNHLPVTFFANLIWQESGLQKDIVSRKGAMGIAQFMPQTAVEKGLDNPFDPLKAIPASARFLRELRMQFGNLGFVAAAYNAGARRVAEWLEHRGNLPRETRTYVVRVTGLSIEAWRGMPVDNDALTFARLLPCRSLPAFANVEQTQWEDAQLEDAKADRGGRNAPPTDETPAARHTPPHDAAHGPARPHERQERQAHQERKDHHEALRAGHDRHTAKREAEHHPHGAHEKRKSA